MDHGRNWRSRLLPDEDSWLCYEYEYRVRGRHLTLHSYGRRGDVFEVVAGGAGQVKGGLPEHSLPTSIRARTEFVLRRWLGICLGHELSFRNDASPLLID